MKALKFLEPGGVGPYSRFRWPLPENGKPGAWVHAKGELVACRNGIHACTLDQSLDWLRAECYVIELAGRIVDEGDKLVARRGRLLYRVETWNERTQRLFAADCAAHVLRHYERAYPDDTRPRKAIEVSRAYARGRATRKELHAALSDASIAADDAEAAHAYAAARAARAAASVVPSALWPDPDSASVALYVADCAAKAVCWTVSAAKEVRARQRVRAWQARRLAHYLGVDL